MRSLCVTDEFPWPATTGYRLRLHHVIRGLAAVGPVDLVVVVDDGHTPKLPTDAPVDRLHVLHLPGARRSIAGYARWIRASAPRTVAARPWSGVRRDLPEVIEALDPDLVWWSHADVYAGTHAGGERPAIVDLDNLEDAKLRDRRAARRRDLADAGRHVTPPVVLKDVLDRADERRWRRLQRHVLDTATVSVVCSDLDRQRLGAPDAVVVPNGYAAPVPAPRRAPDPATLTMIALFTYEPNRDAAEFLVRRVLPIIVARRPDVRVRLVGERDDALDALASPVVTVIGRVPEVGPELERATAVVVPLRFGGGTRLKVLEAFAYGVPVVSTTLGAEGLGVHHDRELLLADDAAGFAAACLEVLDDPVAAAARAAGAHHCWEDRFSGDRMEAVVADLARSTVAASGSGVRT